LGNQGITSGYFLIQYIHSIFKIKHLATVYIANGTWECMGYVWGIVNNICKGRGRYIRDKRGQKLEKKTQKIK
jgi:hypothetical protein